MIHRLAVVGFLILSSWACPVGSVSADPDNKADKTPAAKKGKNAKETDTKADGIKRSQVSGTRFLTGKLTGLDDGAFKLEVGRGNAKTSLEILIAEDAKVRMPYEQEFDNKGKPKPIKRDARDPDAKYGQKASKDDLRDGQTVLVRVGKANKKLVATLIAVVEDRER